jgi:acyloxyacyl hydrolase
VKAAPELTCRLIGLCDRPECVLWDFDSSHAPASPLLQKEILAILPKLNEKWEKPDVSIKEWKFENILIHLPVLDDDNDYHSPMDTLRGGSWRGKDCNDLAGDIYPGRRQSNYGPEIDHNCNGIYGVDASGNSYEDLFCGNSSQRGIIVYGDSISAHFHIPVFSRANLTLDDLFLMALNEVDYPQCSWGTAFADDYKLCSEVSQFPITSVYKKLRERNRCNHRDYQNISRNGARSGSLFNDLVETTSRKPNTDYPALAFYAQLANDICSGRAGTEHMTTPEQFSINVNNSLTYMETLLPPGSTVILLGLIHGELMWDSMFDKPHIIGTTYGELWDFLACLEETACHGWLNADAQARAAANERAEQLNDVLRQFAANQGYKNFNLVYIDHPDTEYHADYAAAGGNLADLYEVIDGGHPSLTGETLFGEYMFANLERFHPELLGPINPNNQKIEELFSDQGGY